jgi:hypothetical protein
MIAWIQANWVSIIAPLLVAIIDLVFALSPNLKANGILNQLFLWLGGKNPPPAA